MSGLSGWVIRLWNFHFSASALGAGAGVGDGDGLAGAGAVGAGAVGVGVAPGAGFSSGAAQLVTSGTATNAAINRPTITLANIVLFIFTSNSKILLQTA